MVHLWFLSRKRLLHHFKRPDNKTGDNCVQTPLVGFTNVLPLSLTPVGGNTGLAPKTIPEWRHLLPPPPSLLLSLHCSSAHPFLESSQIAILCPLCRIFRLNWSLISEKSLFKSLPRLPSSVSIKSPSILDKATYRMSPAESW